jgi:hypothetical protein
MPTDYRAKGLQNMTAWIDGELYRRLKEKLFQDKMTWRDFITRVCENYTGYKVEKNAAISASSVPPGQQR